ncbi:MULTISPECIES: hypothetical protein [Cycloclasticus]|uniref:Uncharacterized protein n=1 Tax=Cycloclasticus pugetii TaxID=34068 RepID=A0AB33Z3Q5_9GAMM|nr:MULTISPECIES: hypothetical protein [Cycloclasticus]ATI02826.1 hypothetical protein CPC19_04870 [Cycloclasticus sp. PY97N]EPD13571.1 hypothetical protein L196_03521 [Cycloclasticus pugetii]
MVEQFAVIVGLISAFSAGRELNKATDMAEFQSWLIEHNHQDILALITESNKSSRFVKAYLNQQVPEIQGKLDKLIYLVENLAGEDGSDELEFTGHHYLKGILRCSFENIFNSNLSSNDFDIAYTYVTDWIGDSARYNEYVLEKMVRESLKRKNTISQLIDKYWFDLVGG